MFSWLKRVFGRSERPQSKQIEIPLMIVTVATCDKRIDRSIGDEILENGIEWYTAQVEKQEQERKEKYEAWVRNCEEVRAIENKRTRQQNIRLVA